MNRFIPSLVPATFFGLAVFGATAGAATVTSAPYAVIAKQIATEQAGLSHPLIAEEVFSGAVSNNSGSIISIQGASNVGAALKANEPYYVEVLSGPLEGERFDVNTSATIGAANGSITLDLGASSHSTLKTLGADVLAQARVAIRPHLTLAKLQGLFSPGLVGNNSVGQADLVRLVSPRGLTVYQLRGDNQTWRESGRTADVRNMVIPPDVGVLVHLRSGAKLWKHSGKVRANAFRKNLTNGMQGFATGFPVDMSPAQIAAFVDASQPQASRWTGSDDPAQADTIRVFDETLNDYVSYYLRADGTSWMPVSGGANASSSPILKATSLVSITRKNSDSEYLILPPFTL